MSEPPYPPPSPNADYADPTEPPSTGMATGSLVLGIVSLPTTCVCIGPVLGLVAIILGIIAAIRVGGDPSRYGGRGRAIGGIITGALSFVLVVVIAAVGWPFMMKFAKPAADLQVVGQGLQTYQAAYQDYPPDLQLVVDLGMMQSSQLGGGGDPAAGVHYVVGLKPSDPSHWIVAYRELPFMGQKLYFLLDVGGQFRNLPQVEFQQALATFEKEYEADRGEPPVILKPPDSSDSEP